MSSKRKSTRKSNTTNRSHTNKSPKLLKMLTGNYGIRLEFASRKVILTWNHHWLACSVWQLVAWSYDLASGWHCFPHFVSSFQRIVIGDTQIVRTVRIQWFERSAKMFGQTKIGFEVVVVIVNHRILSCMGILGGLSWNTFNFGVTTAMGMENKINQQRFYTPIHSNNKTHFLSEHGIR